MYWKHSSSIMEAKTILNEAAGVVDENCST